MTGGGPKAPILHIHSRFDRGAQVLQCVEVINGLGPETMHAIVSAEPGALAASRLISASIPVTCLTKFPPLSGLPTPGRFKRIAEAMKGHGLVLTYGWGAIDAVLAHTLFSEALDLPPLLHHEFSLEECGKSGWRRDWYRQIALGRTAGLIVASRELERMAVESWSQPRNRVHRIEPGIDLAAFERPPRPDFLPLLVKHADEFWIGTCLAQEPAESLLSLTRIFARTPDKWQLVVLGEGVDRARIEHETERLGIEHRVHLLGDNASHKEVFGLFDIFVVAPDGGQSSLTAIEAMAAGLPIVARSAGDIADLVSDRNARYIVPPGDEGGFGDCLAELVESPDERRAVGEANRQMAKERFARERMVERYRRLYAATMGAVPPR